MKTLIKTTSLIIGCMLTLSLSHADSTEQKNEDTLPPIVRHVMTGDAAAVLSYYESGGNVSKKIGLGDSATPLIFFARDLTMTRLLVHLGADPKEKTKDNHTVLMSAVRMGDYDLSRYLVREGLDIHETDALGNNLLHYAVGNMSPRFLKWLIEEGVDPNATNTDGKTPLMESLLHYDIDEIDILLRYGADVTLKDNEGQSVLHYLEKRKEYQERHLYLEARHLIQNQVINQLLERSEPGGR